MDETQLGSVGVSMWYWPCRASRIEFDTSIAHVQRSMPKCDPEARGSLFFRDSPNLCFKAVHFERCLGGSVEASLTALHPCRSLLFESVCCVSLQTVSLTRHVFSNFVCNSFCGPCGRDFTHFLDCRSLDMEPIFQPACQNSWSQISGLHKVV